MSGVRISGDWQRFNKHLHKLAFFNFTALHKEIGEDMVSSTKKRFKTETGPDGKKWPKSRRATAENGQTMTDTAQLKNSINYVAKPEGVAWGTNLKKASTLQGKNGRSVTIRAKNKRRLRFKIGDRWVQKRSVVIPARPFLGLSREDQEDIRAITEDRIKETTE